MEDIIVADTNEMAHSYIWGKIERLADDTTENRRSLDVHLAECASRFSSIQRDIGQVNMWIRVLAIAMVVLFLAEFLHLDAIQLVKLVVPAITVK